MGLKSVVSHTEATISLADVAACPEEGKRERFASGEPIILHLALTGLNFCE